MTHGYSTRAQRFARDSVWNRTFLLSQRPDMLGNEYVNFGLPSAVALLQKHSQGEPSRS